MDFPEIAAQFVGGSVQEFLAARLAQGSGGLLIATVGLTLPMLLLPTLLNNEKSTSDCEAALLSLV